MPATPAAPDRAKRTLIEYCTGDDSLLGKAIAVTQGCTQVRLTRGDDLRTLLGLRTAMLAVQDARLRSSGKVVIWCSILVLADVRGNG